MHCRQKSRNLFMHICLHIQNYILLLSTYFIYLSIYLEIKNNRKNFQEQVPCYAYVHLSDKSQGPFLSWQNQNRSILYYSINIQFILFYFWLCLYVIIYFFLLWISNEHATNLTSSTGSGSQGTPQRSQWNITLISLFEIHYKCFDFSADLSLLHRLTGTIHSI